MDQLTALLLLVFFYAVYYGKLLLQKRKGIVTNQLGGQRAGRERAIALLMGSASVLLALAELASILLGRAPLPLGARALGLALTVLGDLVFLTAVVTMGNSWRAGVNRAEKTELVTGGIYRISRNPAFLGFYLVYTGILLMFFSWWLLAATLLTILLFHLQVVLVEEPFLPEAFGEDYVQYRRHVRRYLGRRGD